MTKITKEKHKPIAYRSLGPISDLEKHLPADWWRTLFNSLYLKTDGDIIENNENTVKEIDLVIKTTGVEPSDNILDLCCGQGRHSIELAKRGFRHVTGIDRSRYLIRLAKKRASCMDLNINFSEGDARKIKLPENSQDTIILMGNSFGYFEKDEDDFAVLNSIKRVLRPKGNLVLDIVNGDWIANHFDPRSWEWIDQHYLVCRERCLSTSRDRIVTREVVVHDEKGIIADQFYAERVYNFERIKVLLEKAGFTDIKLHGNVVSHSSRNQDLGMMANRIFITAFEPPQKAQISIKGIEGIENITVILGDPTMSDNVKKDHRFNEEDLETIKLMKMTLKKIPGFKFNFLNDHENLIRDLLSKKHDFVLNLCDEGFYNNAFKELHVPAFLEMLQIPYSGAGPASLAICYNKSLVRALANNLEIPVPLETYVDPSDQGATLPSIFPALLKPNYGDSSIGITKEALVSNAEELINYLDGMRQQMPGKPILVQEFLSGREFSVSIIGNQGNYKILPILEVDYSKLPKELPKILSYESKWIPDSPYWTSISYREAIIGDEAKRQLIDQSISLFERLECRDYARFDFREDENGIIKLLEVNPNPGWCWDGKLNIMAGFEGLKYENLLELIIRSAIERISHK